MKKIHQEVQNYLYYCKKVRQMSPTTMRSKRNICQRFIATVQIDTLEQLTNEVFNRWVAEENLTPIILLF